MRSVKSGIPDGRKRWFPAAALAAAVGLAGCETTQRRAVHPAEIRRQEDQAIFEERIQRLTGRIEGLEAETAATRAEIAALRRDLSVNAQAETRVLHERIESLDRRLRESDQARERDREQILSSLSGRIAEILSRTGSTGAPRVSRPRGTGYVYEHEVRPGESLSRIAAAYGVTVQSIKDENRLTSDLIRAGQVLLIPEP